MTGPRPEAAAPVRWRAAAWFATSAIVLLVPLVPGLPAAATPAAGLGALGIAGMTLRWLGRRPVVSAEIDLRAGKVRLCRIGRGGSLSIERTLRFAGVAGAEMRRENPGVCSLWLTTADGKAPLFLARGREATLLRLSDRVLADLRRTGLHETAEVGRPAAAAPRFPPLAPPVVAPEAIRAETRELAGQNCGV